MKYIRPIFSTTHIIDRHTWKPNNFDTFIEEINNIVKNKDENSLYLYRGHRNHNWLLDSTFVRYFKKEILRISESEKIKEYVRESLEYNNLIHWFYLFKFGVLARPSDELEEASVNHGVDTWFELMKRIQQYPNEDHPEIKGTNIIDWTKSIDVALFFANDGRSGDGALWIFDSSSTGKILLKGENPVGKILGKMKNYLENKRPLGCPLMFCPEKQIACKRATNQQVIYIAQMDLRYSLDEIWSMIEKEKSNDELVFMRIILPSGSEKDFYDYLLKKKITSSFIFPD